MITTKQIKEFITSNFRIAIISARVVKDKIELSLYLNSEKLDYQSISIYNEDLNKIRKNPKELIEYLFDNYINNKTIIRAEYFANIRRHENKIGFIIESTNSTLQIALEESLMDLLPKNFVNRLETSKRQGIIKVLKDANIKNFSLENVNEKRTGIYKTGLRYYRENKEFPVAYYDAQKIEDTHGKVIIPDYEQKFIKELLKIITEQEEISLNKLKFKYDYLSTLLTTFTKYELNSKTTFTSYTQQGLELYKSFLEEYIKTYEDNVTDNQLKLNIKKLILERKGE